jgi:hypothetical protein
MGVVFPYLNMIDPGGPLIAARPRRRRDAWVFPKELLNADHSGQGLVSGGMRRDKTSVQYRHFRGTTASLQQTDIHRFARYVSFVPDNVAKLPKCRATNFPRKDETSCNRRSMQPQTRHRSLL